MSAASDAGPDSEVKVSLATEHLRAEIVSLLRSHARQQRWRASRIRAEKYSAHRGWLICSLAPEATKKETSVADRVRNVLGGLKDRLPKGAYRMAIASLLADRGIDKGLDDVGLFRASLDRDTKIVVFTHTSIVCLFAPSKRLKRTLVKRGVPAFWDFGLNLISHSADDGGGKARLLEDDIPGLRGLWAKYGRGEGATIAIIDSGICEENTEISGRLVGSWAVKSDPLFGDFLNPGSTGDIFGHGTEVASVAAGSSRGLAPEANVVSIQLPWFNLNGKPHFRVSELFLALTSLGGSAPLAVNGEHPLSKIDTILIALGAYPSLPPREAKIINETLEGIASMYARHGCLVVAPVGNDPRRVSFPADVPNVIAVGAVDDMGQKYTDSGLGINRVGMPIPEFYFRGVDIYCQSRRAELCRKTGTSMAAAGVAGIISVISAYNRRLRLPNQPAVRQNLLKQGVDSGLGLPIIDLTKLGGL